MGALPFRSFLFSSQRSTKPIVSELLPGRFSKGRGGTAVNNGHRRSTPGPTGSAAGVAMQPCSPTTRTLGSLLTNDVWCGQYGKPFERALQKLYSKNRSRGGMKARMRESDSLSLAAKWCWVHGLFFFLSLLVLLTSFLLFCFPQPLLPLYLRLPLLSSL